MQDIKPQIELAEYDKAYASLKEVQQMFFENFIDQQNSNTFKGVFYSMLLKYGKLTYLLLTLPALLLFASLTFIFGLITGPSGAAISSLIISAALNYFIFGHYLVKKINRVHLGFAHEIVEHFPSIEEKYKNNGGKFWLAILHNTATGTKEVIGQLGFRKLEPKDKKIIGIDECLKVGRLDAIGISPKYRGLGIGKKLLEKAISFGKEDKYDKICLSVFTVNTIAMNFYTKFGFRVTQTFEVEPITGYSAYLIVKDL